MRSHTSDNDRGIVVVVVVVVVVVEETLNDSSRDEGVEWRVMGGGRRLEKRERREDSHPFGRNVA